MYELLLERLCTACGGSEHIGLSFRKIPITQTVIQNLATSKPAVVQKKQNERSNYCKALGAQCS